MSLCKGILYALPAHQIHRQCFTNAWTEKEFSDLLNLSTSQLWLNENGLLLCSEVADEMEILTFGVIPEKRHQGEGIRLINQMLEYAQKNGISKIFLDVAENNVPAIRLYEKTGFQKVNVRKGYYENGQVNALVYMKTL